MSASSTAPNFSNDLNAEQLAAVQAPDGPILVIAAAGTGKTRTLTYRVAWLVERGVDARRILLMTFTNRAAHEMLERARLLAGEGVSGLWGGTFHHMANRLLRRHATDIGYQSDYSILDQDDARKIIRACAQERDLTGQHFPKPDVLQSAFSYAVNARRDMLEVAQEHFPNAAFDLQDVMRVQADYQARKHALNAMDFDDLLVNGLKLFQECPALLARYQQQFLYVLVDEYQDTNPIQAEWVDHIATGHRNLLVVGDDFQSIYSWRGADFRNILSFPERYPDAQIYRLETNYRSVPQILEIANICVHNARFKFEKRLQATRPAGPPPLYASLRDGSHQAAFVADRIHRMRREGYALDDMVVLYRSHFHAMELQFELTQKQIPYVVTSGVRFFEQAHIKDVSAPLKLFVNGGDELAFDRLLQLFPKVGERTGKRIWEKLGRRVFLRDEQQVASVAKLLPKAAAEEWGKLAPIFAAFEREHLRHNPGEFIHRFVETFYRAYAMETFDNYQTRIDDIEALTAYCTRFSSTEDFLNEMALMTNLDAEMDAQVGATDPRKVVRLTTVHQAKGLEWPVVFILWMADGMFPSMRALEKLEDEEEERRLFYVATTRARDHLFLCVPAIRRTRDGGMTSYIPSRFVREIAEQRGLMRMEQIGFI